MRSELGVKSLLQTLVLRTLSSLSLKPHHSPSLLVAITFQFTLLSKEI